MVAGNIAAAANFIRDRRLRALAVTSKERSPQFPDIPTVAESGFPEAENVGWFGLFAPAGLPKEIIAKIHKDAVAAVGTAEIKSKLDTLGMVPVGNRPEEFISVIDQEFQSWEGVVRARKLLAQ